MFSKLSNISLTTKLIILYTLSTIGILTVVCILLYSTFISLAGQHLTLPLISFCYKRVLIVLLLGSLTAMAMGIIITKEGLAKIKEFSNKVEKVSVGSLHQPVVAREWPVELTQLAGKFNGMLSRIQSSFNQLSDYSSDIAHELRGPINNLRGKTEIALTSEKLPEEYRKILESYMDEYSHLSSLIENLLFLARTDHGQIEINKQAINAHDEINKVCDYYQPLAEDHSILISCEGEAKIAADPTLFKRVISNLLSNALRYTPKGGNINISIACAANNETSIHIQDTGIGIEEGDIPKLFQRFYRVDASRTLQSGGMGLGLAIVKSIVDLHKGKITIHSQPEQGTLVTLLLPSN